MIGDRVVVNHSAGLVQDLLDVVDGGINRPIIVLMRLTERENRITPIEKFSVMKLLNDGEVCAVRTDQETEDADTVEELDTRSASPLSVCEEEKEEKGMGEAGRRPWWRAILTGKKKKRNASQGREKSTLWDSRK